MFELSVFFQAIEDNHPTHVREALRAHPEMVMSESAQGLLPLVLASHYGFREIVDLLLTHGADVNCMSHSRLPFFPSNTPLHAAIEGKNDPVVILKLLNAGARMDILDSNGCLPLHVAALKDRPEVIGLLLEHGASPDATTANGETALHIAERADRVDIAAILKRERP